MHCLSLSLAFLTDSFPWLYLLTLKPAPCWFASRTWNQGRANGSSTLWFPFPLQPGYTYFRVWPFGFPSSCLFLSVLPRSPRRTALYSCAILELSLWIASAAKKTSSPLKEPSLLTRCMLTGSVTSSYKHIYYKIYSISPRLKFSPHLPTYSVTCPASPPVIYSHLCDIG